MSIGLAANSGNCESTGSVRSWINDAKPAEGYRSGLPFRQRTAAPAFAIRRLPRLITT
jgi:hypothetical protein